MSWTTLDDNSNYAYMDVTIASGGSLSASVDLEGYRLVRVDMPASWTAANLTWQVSTDDSTFYDLYIDGSEYTTTADASNAYGIPVSDSVQMYRYLKVRSGTSSSAVSQGADRTIRLVAAYFE